MKTHKAILGMNEKPLHPTHPLNNTSTDSRNTLSENGKQYVYVKAVDLPTTFLPTILCKTTYCRNEMCSISAFLHDTKVCYSSGKSLTMAQPNPLMPRRNNNKRTFLIWHESNKVGGSAS